METTGVRTMEAIDGNHMCLKVTVLEQTRCLWSHLSTDARIGVMEHARSLHVQRQLKCESVYAYWR